MECIDRYCKTNNPDSKAICNNCLVATIKGMSESDLMDLYCYINNLLHTSDNERKMLDKLYGPILGAILGSVEEQWFKFINDLLLDNGGRR